MAERGLVPVERIERAILLVRGHRVMLDADLAELYGVPTKRLNEQVKRNLDRFPLDFMFRLTRSEVEKLNRSQIATGSQRHRDPRFTPYVFTEHGAIMAANVLNSRRAVEASVWVVRAFVRLRQISVTHRILAAKLAELERRVGAHDGNMIVLLDAIRELMAQPRTKRRRIGFRAEGR